MPALKLLRLGLILLSSLVVSCTLNQTSPNVFAQTTPAPAATEILQAGEVRPLPGQLDTIPLFNT